MSDRPGLAVGQPAPGSDPNKVADKGTVAAPAGDVVERVVASLLDLSFVLTDREGFVTRWTPRAERLLGVDAAGAAGRALMETFGAGDAEAPAAGRIQVEAQHRDGQRFRSELTFIPVPMSHSLEFNGFLESLESDRPAESILRRVNSQHRDVLDWIGSVVTDGVPLHSDELTAGTIVAFRPVDEVPWLVDPTPPKPDAPQPGVADAVDRAAEVLARSDALERTLDEAGVAVDEARATADAAHEEATKAAKRVTQLADENTTLRSELERAHSELRDLRERFDSEPSGSVSSDELSALRAEVEALRDAPPAVSPSDLEALKDELGEQLQGAGGGETAAQRAEAGAEAVRALADELRRELEEMRQSAAEARKTVADAVESAAVEARVARAQAEAARVHSEEAGGHAQAARDIAEAWTSAAEKYGRASDNGRREGPSEPPKTRPAPEPKAQEPAREPRPGFDDAENPMAVIELGGRFRELNKGFSELVGFSEGDFQSASWPPVADRAQLEHHREQMRALQEGEVDAVEVNTGYVHAQGLMVPIAGTFSLVRGDDGEPSHFLLSVGAPVSAS